MSGKIYEKENQYNLSIWNFLEAMLHDDNMHLLNLGVNFFLMIINIAINKILDMG